MADQIVDACCLINLYASSKVEAILPACGGDFYVTEHVRAEALSIRRPDHDDPSLLVASPIDLSAAIAGGLIKACDFEGEAELALFVEFATVVDDGEASCLAIAKSRGWLVATDDRKAIRIALESGISVITTPELVQRWAIASIPSERELADVLRCIERFARFRPRRGSPLQDWWADHADRAS